jgi:hypothetical protein
MGGSVDSENMGREESAPKSRVVVEADVVNSAEGSICWTDRARFRGATGVPSPGHVFIWIPQELGKYLSIPRIDE